MKISLAWLKDYVALDQPVEEIARAITFLGFEVEGIASTGAPRLDHVVVGEVKVRDKHPNADKLSVCQVDIGPAGGLKTIVCGAQNYKVGDRVPVALPGAVLPGNFTIKQSKIRGQLSDGMMCSGAELGISDDKGGLLLLDGSPPIGSPINAVLPPGDTIFDLEITPNRPDCLSHLGIARELAAWFDQPLNYPKLNASADAQDPDLAKELLSEVRVDALEDCPLYTAQVIAGVKVGPSPAWLKDRLAAVGLRPINNVVDVGNYVMLEYGQPLHAFDAGKLAGRKLIVRRAADGEKIVTLDGRERTLNSRMLVIADAERPVVIAGIMGGENSGVDLGTVDLVLECAIFKPSSIRRTSRKLGLASDSSYRYERGVDAHSAKEAAARAIDLLLATAGGRAVGPSIAIGGDIPWRREIAVTTEYIRDRLGFEIPAPEMKSSLESLELKVVREESSQGGGLAWTVSIPSWRDDLDRPIDLVEEVLRLYGTDRIPPAVVISPGLAAEDDPAVSFNRRATDYLVGHDFHECVNTTLRSTRDIATWVSEAAAQELALANPFVEDQSHLRPTLIVGLLETIRLNQSRGVPVSRLAETGRVFIERNGLNFECAAVAFVIADDFERRWSRREPADFFTVKHHIEALARIAGIDFSGTLLLPISDSHFGWEENHSAVAGISNSTDGGEAIHGGWTARFGLLNLAMVKALGIEGKVYAGILTVLPERLPSGASRRRYADFSLFPAAFRDLALVVESGTPAAEVQKTLETLARQAVGSDFTLAQLTLFDLYQGKGLPEGRKSLAFSLAFRSADRTLTDDEVNAVFNKIQDALVRDTGYSIRK